MISLRLYSKESMKGGATKRASSTIYNIPSTYTGEIFGLIIYFSLAKIKFHSILMKF